MNDNDELSNKVNQWLEELKNDLTSHDFPIPEIKLRETNKNDEEDADIRYEVVTKYCEYIISAYQGEESYLGCIMHNRYPYKGQTRVCGADLPDGELDEDTWESIKDAIIDNELETLTDITDGVIEFEVSK